MRKSWHHRFFSYHKNVCEAGQSPAHSVQTSAPETPTGSPAVLPLAQNLDESRLCTFLPALGGAEAHAHLPRVRGSTHARNRCDVTSATSSDVRRRARPKLVRILRAGVLPLGAHGAPRLRVVEKGPCRGVVPPALASLAALLLGCRSSVPAVLGEDCVSVTRLCLFGIQL